MVQLTTTLPTEQRNETANRTRSIRPVNWKKLSSKVIYDNPWMTVVEDRVINPSGGRNDYGHIRFKTRAVAILPIDEDGNTWIVGQDRYTLGQYSWEVPMGGAQKGEDALAAAKRELREETGLQAQDWSEVLHLHTSNSITDEEGFVYVAKGLRQGATDFEETEKLDIRKLPMDDAVAMAQDGRITDAVSVAALLWVNQNLRHT